MIDFSEPQSTDAGYANGDRVMGGLSRSGPRHDLRGHAVFEGEVSSQKGGGFAPLRSRPDEGGRPHARDCVIDVRGARPAFGFSLLMDDGVDSLNDQADVAPAGDDWLRLTLPLVTFGPQFRGRGHARRPAARPEVGELPARMRAKPQHSLQVRSFFRPDVIRIGLPPLCERAGHVRWLTEHLLQPLAAGPRRPVAMSQARQRDAMALAWSGDAQEMRSDLEEAVVLSEAGILDMPEQAATSGRNDSGDGYDSDFASLRAMVEDAERRLKRDALDRTGGSVMKTFELLGISRETPWEKMKKLRLCHGIDRLDRADALPLC